MISQYLWNETHHWSVFNVLFQFQLNLRWTDELSGSLTKRLITQAGPWSVWRTGALTSTWASPAWSCCAWSGGCTRLVASWQVRAFGRQLWPRNCWDKFANWWLSLPPHLPTSPTGLISEVELGSQSIIIQVANIAYMVIIPLYLFINLLNIYGWMW